MAFRAEVRRALASPLGGALAQQFPSPRVTAIVGDAHGSERDTTALAELVEALVQVGLPRGRMFVLLAGATGVGESLRERARMLRDTLGMPVIPHDPARTAAFRAGVLPNLGALELDDELREAEGVIVAGSFSRHPSGEIQGGPAALLPGLANADTRARLARCDDVDGLVRAAAALVGVDFALIWSADDPPRLCAGEGRAVFAHAEAHGWLAVGPGR